MALHVTALFTDRLTAHAAVEQLVQAGFPRDVISVLMSARTHDREFALRSGVRVAGWVSSGASSGKAGAVTPVGVLASIAASVAPVADGIVGSGPLVRGGSDYDDTHEQLRAGALLVAVTTAHADAHLARQVLELAGGEAQAA